MIETLCMMSGIEDDIIYEDILFDSNNFNNNNSSVDDWGTNP